MANGIDVSAIDFSKPRVRYKGKVQDKCDLSYLIHETAFMCGNRNWPLWSDIYWDSARYDELKEKLQDNVNKLKAKDNEHN